MLPHWLGWTRVTHNQPSTEKQSISMSEKRKPTGCSMIFRKNCLAATKVLTIVSYSIRNAHGLRGRKIALGADFPSPCGQKRGRRCCHCGETNHYASSCRHRSQVQSHIAQAAAGWANDPEPSIWKVRHDKLWHSLYWRVAKQCISLELLSLDLTVNKIRRDVSVGLYPRHSKRRN